MGQGGDTPPREVRVRVTPRAARARVEETAGMLRVHVAVPPEGGQANAAAADLIARHFGVAKSRVRLVSGARSREKRFAIT